jgi:glycerol-3-phosphate acyltransferase PlsY
MELDLVFSLICFGYFLGGITIGYYVAKKRNEKKGEGRWD